MLLTALQYDSLKTVLQYIEANKRFCLFLRIPAIHFAEKAVPLKIDYLQFGDYGVTVNKTSYYLRVYRNFHQGEEIVDYFQKENDEGGIRFDLDQYGFQLPTNMTDLVPGEVIFGDVRVANHNFALMFSTEFPWSFQQDDQKMKRYYEKHLEIYKIALERRLDRGEPGNLGCPSFPFPVMFPVFTEDELLAMSGSVLQELTAEERESKLVFLSRVPTWILEKAISRLSYCFQPFDCRHNNRPLPFTPLIQLIIKKEGQEKRIERYAYTMKLHEAVRKLNGLIFGGRKAVVQAHTFPFIAESVALRIPQGLKIRVRELRFKGNMNGRFEALNNLIDESSYPLESLSILHQEEDIDYFAHPALTSAQRIYLVGAAPLDIDLLLNLSNKIVHFKYIWSPDFSTEELMTFARKIITAGSPVGVQRTFRMSHEDSIDNILNRVGIRTNR
ncbi:hypothetical protein CRE_30126 [Caenorhabditis remanei]|uniref:Uncharacterized protein n=1 Tax=Caenorhabditis remanei TaxID=31234 RepID=E3N627_CAERE|nr:hypothetical protein CRE_30126 [Caenorhabditis remanei]